MYPEAIVFYLYKDHMLFKLTRTPTKQKHHHPSDGNQDSDEESTLRASMNATTKSKSRRQQQAAAAKRVKKEKEEEKMKLVQDKNKSQITKSRAALRHALAADKAAESDLFKTKLQAIAQAKEMGVLGGMLKTYMEDTLKDLFSKDRKQQTVLDIEDSSDEEGDSPCMTSSGQNEQNENNTRINTADDNRDSAAQDLLLFSQQQQHTPGQSSEASNKSMEESTQFVINELGTSEECPAQNLSFNQEDNQQQTNNHTNGNLPDTMICLTQNSVENGDDMRWTPQDKAMMKEGSCCAGKFCKDPTSTAHHRVRCFNCQGISHVMCGRTDPQNRGRLYCMGCVQTSATRDPQLFSRIQPYNTGGDDSSNEELY
jgi:hypothetical protein